MIVTCPRCGFRFDTSYARAYSCKSCPVLSTSLTCDFIKCPKCGYEFELPQP